MKELFQNNAIKVGSILVFSLMVIIYFNPPHTPCQSQAEVYDDAVKPLIKPFNKAMDLCKDHADPGGCVEFFEVLNRVEGKYNEVTPSCRATLAKDAITKSWIISSMELMVRLAWGSQPPSSYLYRNGWLEFSQVVKFCQLRHTLQNLFGDGAWNGFAGNLMNDLPGAAGLNQTAGRTEVWNRTLLSDPCNYPL